MEFWEALCRGKNNRYRKMVNYKNILNFNWNRYKIIKLLVRLEP